MKEVRLAVLGLACAISIISGCTKTPQRPAGQRKPQPQKIVESVYEGSLSPAWSERGWAPKLSGKNGPATFDLSKQGGWAIGRQGLSGALGGLVFRFRAPVEYGDFLEVRVESTKDQLFPRIKPGPEHRVDLPDDWSEVFIPMAELNPKEASFDRLIIRAYRSIDKDPVAFDKMGFTAPQNSANPSASLDAKKVKMVIECIGKSQPINPMIYGTAYDLRGDISHSRQGQLNSSARRWGGNPSTRYNWQLGNAWNTANDWYFRNVNYSDNPNFTYDTFLEDNLARRLKTALTIPIMGWVAKDLKSYSFPVTVYGEQRAVDPNLPDAGDGYAKDGKPLLCNSPNRTSTYQSPASVLQWIKKIRAKDQERKTRSVDMYILDNEPFLWNSTHRDVHPLPTTYDELLEKTIAYGTAIRQADPEGVIAGPALWGWPALFYSAKDAAEGFETRPDRRAHGDVPFLPWYLHKLREHEKKTGVRIIDVVDVHFYPQGKGIKGDGGETDPETNARRIRATRGLWDSSYTDESWIQENIRLIPRLRQWINENYPGLGISIGEYNFGAENHMSGALALSEALGQFARNGVDSAFYWTSPPNDSFAFWSFQAWRNFDGQGGRFLDWLVDTRAPPQTSLFASQEKGTNHMVAIAMNFDPQQAADASIDLASCGAVAKRRTFSLTGQTKKLESLSEKSNEGGFIHEVLPPYSLTVFDIELADRHSLQGKGP